MTESAPQEECLQVCCAVGAVCQYLSDECYVYMQAVLV